MDFDEVADEVYGIPPEEFIATRRAREEQARAEGDRVLAKSISVLPKPSLAAWAVNVLVRAHRDEIEGLVELGGLLREAQENLAGDQLRALSVQRNQLLAALSRQVMALTRELGHPVSSGVTGQVEETLRAAMADTEAGEAVLSGRLTAPLSYSGLGTGQRPDLRVVRPPAQDRSGPAAARKAHTTENQATEKQATEKRATEKRATEKQATEKQATEKQATKDGSRTPAEQRRRAAEERRRREEEAARREAEERRRRELAEAQQAADEATEAADEAAAAAEAEQVRLEEVDARHERLQARVDELMDELARTREEVTTANAQLSRAQRRRQAAGRRAAEAATTRDRALQRLEDLRREG